VFHLFERYSNGLRNITCGIVLGKYKFRGRILRRESRCRLSSLLTSFLYVTVKYCSWEKSEEKQEGIVNGVLSLVVYNCVTLCVCNRSAVSFDSSGQDFRYLNGL